MAHDPIKFGVDKDPLRYQQTIFENWRSNNNAVLPVWFRDALIALTGLIFVTYLTAKILTSKSDCRTQLMHADDDNYYAFEGIKHFKKAPFSLILALEESANETCIFVREGKIILERGDVIAFRGDFVHAVAAYSKRNRRLFIAAESEDFPNEGIFVKIAQEIDD